MPSFVYVVFAAILSSVGTLLVRYGGKDLIFSQGLWHLLTHRYLWFCGIFVGWIGGLSVSLLLTRMDASQFASLWTPLVYIFIFLGGVFFLGESISSNKIVGSALLFVGLYFITRQ